MVATARDWTELGFRSQVGQKVIGVGTTKWKQSLRLYRISIHRSLDRLNVGARDIGGRLAGRRVHAKPHHRLFDPAGGHDVDANASGRLERRHSREALETCIYHRDCPASDHWKF